MNRWSFCLLLLMISCSINVFCQNTNKKENSIDNKLIVSVSPLGLVDFFFDYPSVRLTGEAKLYKNLSVSVENVFYPGLHIRAIKENATGFAVKPCIKLYLNRQGIVGGKYIGLEYQYKQQQYELTDSIRINGDEPFKKHYGMTRYVNCINLKYGELTQLRKRWVIEWFGGIGVRYLNSFSDLPEQEYNGIIYGENRGNSKTGPGGSIRYVGNTAFLNFTAGFKIGYRIL